MARRTDELNRRVSSMPVASMSISAKRRNRRSSFLKQPWKEVGRQDEFTFEVRRHWRGTLVGCGGRESDRPDYTSGWASACFTACRPVPVRLDRRATGPSSRSVSCRVPGWRRQQPGRPANRGTFIDFCERHFGFRRALRVRPLRLVGRWQPGSSPLFRL